MSKKKMSKWGLYGAVSLVLLGIVVLLVVKKPREKEGVVKEVPVGVLVQRVHPTNVVEVVDLPAMLRARVDATLSAEKAGRVVNILVDQGDVVKKGEVLLQIDDRTEQALLKQVKIAARDTQKNFERFKGLKKAGAVADSEYDQVEKAAVVAEARMEEVKVAIEKCQVRSPENGVVNDRFVEVGEYVLPGTPLFQVVDVSMLKVEMQIPEKDIFAIHRGERISFGVESVLNHSFTGVVSFVAVQADPENNAFRAELLVRNEAHFLRPGMIARVHFARGIRKEVFSLPVSAVLPSKGDHIVYVVEHGRVIRRNVKIASLTRWYALISSGLVEGDLVVVEGNRTLSDGQRVEVLKP